MDVHVLLAERSALQSVVAAVRVLRRVGIRAEVRVHEDWVALTDVLASASPSPVIVDPYHSGDFDLTALRRLCGLVAPAACVAYADFRGRPIGPDVAELLDLGISAVVTRGVDDTPYELSRRVRGTLGIGTLYDTIELCRPHLGVDPVRWTPDFFGERSPRCEKQTALCTGVPGADGGVGPSRTIA